MAGLETMVLAVAHLESIQGGDVQPPVTVLSDSVSKEAAELPYLKLHGRMVSDDSIYEAHPRSLASSSGEPLNSEMSTNSMHNQYHQPWLTNDAHQAAPSNVKQTPVDTTVSDVAFQEKDSAALPPGPVGLLLERVAMVNEDLDEFFVLMEKLEQLALPDGMKPAEIPKPDEIIHQVQRYDVLLGRGGETNHHVGNIQYRQLVKACQPAYLAAKRRDKPRIAVAIVQVVRAHSGRFLKKHPSESSWGDVGSIRAREKTSQALREGAPELRGVESQRSHLHAAVESSIDRKLRHVLNSSNPEFSFDPRQMHLPNATHVLSNGNETHPGLNPRNTTKHNRCASTQSTKESSGAISRPLLIPPKGLTIYPMHHCHVPMPMAPGHMFYHHPHGHVMYHPNAGMDGRYHHIYSDKRAMLAPSVSEPPKKRQQFLQPRTTQVQTGSQIPDHVNLSQHINVPFTESDTIEKSTNVALISADNSEEEPVPVQSASSTSSTSSSKNANSTCRGPRLKLLKQRFEEGSSAVVE